MQNSQYCGWFRTLIRLIKRGNKIMQSVRFVVITGLSGAGKTVALRALEDMGFFCIDNLPSTLMPRFAELLSQPENFVDKVALVVDIRGGAFFDEALQALDELQQGHRSVSVLFLKASDEVLIDRFKETRRRHPLAGEGSMPALLMKERGLLEPFRARAEHIIDTSELTPADLQQRLFQLFGDAEHASPLLLSVISFGFKHGSPRVADLVFDVRFLSNPHYEDELRPLTGLEPDVVDYVWEDEVTQDFFGRLSSFVNFLLPHYESEGKSQLVLAVGCTGGRHRSVVIARKLGEFLQQEDYRVVVEHRDIDVDVDSTAEGSS